jgi:glyoxylase-like metal-dependent hydrolase (beta-lactamase superfamily II)
MFADLQCQICKHALSMDHIKSGIENRGTIMRIRILQLITVLLVASFTFAQSPIPTADANKRGLTDKDFPKQIKLAENVYAFEILPPQGRNAQPGASRVTTNSMVVITTDGVLIADGQGNPAAANRLMDEIKKLTSQPIKYVIVCSEHADHTGGNSAFPSTATFFATPFSKSNLETQANASNRPNSAPKIVIPTETVSDKRVLKSGNTEIQILNLGRSHTGGDLSVYLPKEKVLWMSESFNPSRFPTLRTGFPIEWVKTIDKAQHMDVQYYAGAHGFIDDPKTMKANLAEYRKALETVIAEAKRLHKPGADPDEAFKQANFGPYASWTDYNQVGAFAFKRAWDDIDGKLK